MDWTPLVSSAWRTWLFAPQELQDLRRLRQRYRHQPDIFTDRELSKLQFFRWLAQTGRLPCG